MAKEIETATEKGIQKNPHTIRSLIWKWVVALLLMLFILPLLGDILNSLFPVYWSPDMKDIGGWLFVPSMLYFFYMVVWTVRFFLKKKQSSR